MISFERSPRGARGLVLTVHLFFDLSVLIALFHQRKGKLKVFVKTSEKLVGKLNVDMLRLNTFSGCMTLEPCICFFTRVF